MDIKGKIAVVTGGASGIGRAVATELAKRGVSRLGLVDQNEVVNDVADAINTSCGDHVARPFVGDVTDSAFRSSVYDRITNGTGPVNICVPAAGITRDALAARIDKETGEVEIYPIDTFRQVTEVDLIAPIYWSLELVARIAKDRRARGLKRWEPGEEIQGTVILIGSVSSQGNKGQISYATAKAGLEGAAATIMAEAIYHGVRCGVIHPGYTDTPMVRALGEEFIEQRVLPHTLLRRLIRPEEIADAICFMIANPAVSREMWADGGWHPPA